MQGLTCLIAPCHLAVIAGELDRLFPIDGVETGYETVKKVYAKAGVKENCRMVKTLKQADRMVINLECALTTTDKAIKKFGPCLKADPKCADTLKKLGVTDVMLSNNHVFDFVIQGLRDTMKNLERVGLPYTGVGENDTHSRKPHIIEQDGKRIGFNNVCEHEYSYALPDRMGTNPYDPYLTMRDIRALKKQVGHVIVLYHGGKEHCLYPSPRLRLLCLEGVLRKGKCKLYESCQQRK